jgi:hypothetical protein
MSHLEVEKDRHGMCEHLAHEAVLVMPQIMGTHTFHRKAFRSLETGMD